MDARHYVPPQFERDAFNCPHCGAFAHQDKRAQIEKRDGKQEEKGNQKEAK